MPIILRPYLKISELKNVLIKNLIQIIEYARSPFLFGQDLRILQVLWFDLMFQQVFISIIRKKRSVSLERVSNRALDQCLAECGCRKGPAQVPAFLTAENIQIGVLTLECYRQQQFNNKMENMNLRTLVAQLESKTGFAGYLSAMESEFVIKLYKTTEINPHNVVELYSNLQKKFYLNKRVSKHESWFENELRLYIWLLFAYAFVHQKSITELDQQTWNYFSEIFNHKSPLFFQFQMKSILKNEGRPPQWTEEEQRILEEVIMQQDSKNHWNSIARELYLRSNRKYFRSPKQCREKWMNHLDPSKIRTQWTPSEDLVLLTTIKKKGRKWSLVVKELTNTRTQHMVKNRYKSLIANEGKKYPNKRESEIETMLIKRLQKQQAKGNANSLKLRERQVQTSLKLQECEKIAKKSKPIISSCHFMAQRTMKMESIASPAIQVCNFDFKDQSQIFRIHSPFHLSFQESQSNEVNFLGEAQMFDLEDPMFELSMSSHQDFLQI